MTSVAGTCATAPRCSTARSTFFEPFRQPAQAKQDAARCHDLDEQLRHGEVGRRKPDEGDAGDKSRATDQDRARQAGGTWPARPRRRRRRCRQPRPSRRAGSKLGGVGGRSFRPVRQIGQQRGEERCRDQEAQLRLQALGCRACVSSAARPAPAHRRPGCARRCAGPSGRRSTGRAFLRSAQIAARSRA